MNFLPSFHAIGSLWLALLAIPLILFYFLKLRRPRIVVASLALWRQVMEDQRVNSPFQKFKRNLLLLLQLLLLFLLILAAMQPYMGASNRNAVKLPILIDTSASMASLDGSNGVSRLDLAKDRLHEMIDGMLPDDQFSIIAFSDSAVRLTPFTDNQRVLREAVDGLKISDVPSRIEDGLRMVEAMGRNDPVARAVMITDGNIPAQVDFNLSFELDYERIRPSPISNIGITAFNGQRRDDRSWQVFLSVESSGPEAISAQLHLIRDGERIVEERILLNPGGGDRLAFTIAAEEATRLKAELIPIDSDAVVSDNQAWLDLPAQRPLRVYISPGLRTVRRAMSAIDGVELHPIADQSGTASSEYDLVITNLQEDLTKLKSPTWMSVGIIPAVLRDLLGTEQGAISVVDWREEARLLEYVTILDVLTLRRPKIATGIGLRDFEAVGFTPLIETRTGPLLLETHREGRHGFVWLLDFDQTTLPYRVGFPVMLQNLVRLAREDSGLGEVDGIATGVLPPRQMPALGEYVVRGPDGSEVTSATDERGWLRGIPVKSVGEYTILQGTQLVDRIGVGLLNRRETTLNAIDEIAFTDIQVAVSEVESSTDRQLWRWLALAGLAVLLVEWWYFQRLPGGRQRAQA